MVCILLQKYNLWATEILVDQFTAIFHHIYFAASHHIVEDQYFSIKQNMLCVPKCNHTVFFFKKDTLLQFKYYRGTVPKCKHERVLRHNINNKKGLTYNINKGTIQQLEKLRVILIGLK